MNSQHASLGTCALSTLLSLVVSVFTLTGQAKAQCQYEVTILQFPIDCGIGTVNTTGLSLNENGAVVGYYRCPIAKFFRPFLWTPDEGFTDLGLPPGVMEAIPTDINDQGIICGEMIVSGVGKRGFVYDHGAWAVLPPVVDILGTWSSAAAINNDGIVVGQRSITDLLNPQNAYIWSAAEGFIDLGVMNGPNSAGTAISDSALVAGWTGTNVLNSIAFIFDTGALIFLPEIPDVTTSFSRAITTGVVVVGSLRLQPDGFPYSFARGFLWSIESDKVTLLEPIPNYEHSALIDLSDHLTAVGQSTKEDDPNDRRATLWISGQPHDVNDLVPAQFGVLVQRGSAINNSEQILADGDDANGDNVTFLLTPKERPAGDLDSDCRVGILDLLMLLASWGPCDACAADLNDDGTVNVFDLTLLLINWG